MLKSAKRRNILLEHTALRKGELKKKIPLCKIKFRFEKVNSIGIQKNKDFI